MNDNIVRHRILRELSKITIKNDVKSITQIVNEQYDLTLEELPKRTKCSDIEIRRSVSLLLLNNEVFLLNTEKKGLLIEEAGVSAYSTNKYIKVFYNNIISIIKDVVQILIPVISMIIALIAVANSDSKKSDMLEIKMQKMQIQLKDIGEYIKRQQDNTAKPTTLYYGKDSLKN